MRIGTPGKLGADHEHRRRGGLERVAIPTIATSWTEKGRRTHVVEQLTRGAKIMGAEGGEEGGARGGWAEVWEGRGGRVEGSW